MNFKLQASSSMHNTTTFKPPFLQTHVTRSLSDTTLKTATKHQIVHTYLKLNFSMKSVTHPQVKCVNSAANIAKIAP